jgi:hypothetical protein
MGTLWARACPGRRTEGRPVLRRCGSRDRRCRTTARLRAHTCVRTRRVLRPAAAAAAGNSPSRRLSQVGASEPRSLGASERRRPRDLPGTGQGVHCAAGDARGCDLPTWPVTSPVARRRQRPDLRARCHRVGGRSNAKTARTAGHVWPLSTDLPSGRVWSALAAASRGGFGFGHRGRGTDGLLVRGAARGDTVLPILAVQRCGTGCGAVDLGVGVMCVSRADPATRGRRDRLLVRSGRGGPRPYGALDR